MIQESYVSYEVAKLLKEKGFNIPCRFNYRSMYPNNPKPFYHKSLKDFNGKEYEGLRSEWFSAPTHQTAMKWLREKHNIAIEINLDDFMTAEDGSLKVWYSYTIWTFIQHLGETGLVDSRYDDRAYWQENVKVGQTYEETCEAAIKYCLENLI